ncbi:MAG: hypothetical protein WAM85_03110 [Terracidiphilus sp.]
MNQRLAKLILRALLVAALGAQACLAQAPIDPSLPEAPLPQIRVWVVSRDDGTVWNPDTPVASLRPRQKFEIAFKKIASPSLFIRAGFASEFDKGLGVGPFYAPGGRGFAQLFGYNAANYASSTLFADALMPVVFHQDPRYFRKGSGPVLSRIGWALRSEAVAYSDKGKEMPNYAGILGFGMSTALSAAYLPSQNVSFGKTIEGWGIKEGISSGFRVFAEFDGISMLEMIHRRPKREHSTRTSADR